MFHSLRNHRPDTALVSCILRMVITRSSYNFLRKCHPPSPYLTITHDCQFMTSTVLLTLVHSVHTTVASMDPSS